MGTAETLPPWAAEIQIMEQMGWTERELHEEVSQGTILRIGILSELRVKAAKVKEHQAQARAKTQSRMR